jgi:hypothetical protein
MKTFYDYILKNGGASANVWIEGKRGYGYNIPELKNGFMVSLKAYEQKIPLHRFNIDDLKHYAKRYASVFSRDVYMLGVWIDKGIVYLDVSVRVMNIYRALDLVKENEQKAFYDLQKQKSFDRFMNEIV